MKPIVTLTFLTFLAINVSTFVAANKLYDPEFCGNRDFDPIFDRIMGGDEANPEQFPNAVAIFRDGNYICTGSLIARGFIVTAAHCFSDFTKTSFLDKTCGKSSTCVEKYTGPGNSDVCGTGFLDIDIIKNNITVLLGGLPLNSSAKKRSIINIDLSYVEFFKRGCRQHDIAILETEDTGDAMYSCLLPLVNVNLNHSMTDAIGFGSDPIKHLSTHNELQYLNTGLLQSRKKCIELTNNFLPVDGICVTEIQDKNTCMGDSGGPLMTYYENKDQDDLLTTLGVLSFGTNCADLRNNKTTAGAVYTRLDFYHNLINTVLKLDGFFDDLSFSSDEVNMVLS